MRLPVLADRNSDHEGERRGAASRMPLLLKAGTDCKPPAQRPFKMGSLWPQQQQGRQPHVQPQFGQASGVTSLLFHSRPPFVCRGLHAFTVLSLEIEELSSDTFETSDVRLHLSEPPTHKRFGVTTRTSAVVPNVEQLLDVSKAQSHMLYVFDEPQALGCVVVIDPITSGCALRRVQDPTRS